MILQRHNAACAKLAAALIFACAGAAAHAGRRTVALSTGTVVPVHLQEGLSSESARKGDRFTATVDSSSTGGDWVSDALPAGSRVQGYVRSVAKHHGKTPGALDLAFNRVLMPDGKAYAIQGSLISLDNKSVTRDRNGRLIAAKGHTNNRLTYVGYGAGAGALVGLLTSRKHVLEDTLLGAGAGLLYGALQKGKGPSDVNLKSGTQMGMRLDRRLTYSIR